MAELEDYGINRATLQRMYEEWRAGKSKSHLEQKYLGKSESHGKLFSSLVRRFLGYETERRHRMADELQRLRNENTRLRALLRSHGIDPDARPVSTLHPT
mgnify:CR=1 FL=1